MTKRLQIDLTAEAVERLTHLQVQANARSIPDLARMSLALMDWYQSRRAEGYEVFLRRGDEIVKADLVSPHL